MQKLVAALHVSGHAYMNPMPEQNPIMCRKSSRHDLINSTKKKTEYTLRETNIAPENGWLEDFPFAEAYFQVLCKFQRGYLKIKILYI